MPWKIIPFAIVGVAAVAVAKLAEDAARESCLAEWKELEREEARMRAEAIETAMRHLVQQEQRKEAHRRQTAANLCEVVQREARDLAREVASRNKEIAALRRLLHECREQLPGLRGRQRAAAASRCRELSLALDERLGSRTALRARQRQVQAMTSPVAPATRRALPRPKPPKTGH